MVINLQKTYFEEFKIINLIKENNRCAVLAFEKLLRRFQEEYEKNGTIDALIIDSIYVKQNFSYLWQLARDNHLSDSTLLRYRKKYLEWFSFYYEKEMQSEVS